MKDILAYSTWHTPATEYPRVQVGSFRIASHKYTKGYYNMSGLLDQALFQATKPLTITNLQECVNGKWEQWMVDDPPHWEAMKFYASKAKGRVLTTGLGLGLIIHALATNPAVQETTVVELSPEVIALTGDHLPGCVTIVQDDFYEFLAATSLKFDTCIIDLWVAHDFASKMRAFAEAIQVAARLKTKWPKAKLFFHGFPTLCDEVWPMSKETKVGLTMLAEGRGLR